MNSKIFSNIDPRCGSLGFLPKKRCKRERGKIKPLPNDNFSKPCKLSAFLGFKSGMTHIIRKGTIYDARSKVHQGEFCESVTLIETPPLVIAGIVGYIKTPRGLRSLNTFFTKHLSEEVRRKFYRNWYANKKRKAFTKYINKYKGNMKLLKMGFDEMKHYCYSIRVLCHTQIRMVSKLNNKKSHLVEIEILGGSIHENHIFPKLFRKRSSCRCYF